MPAITPRIRVRARSPVENTPAAAPLEHAAANPPPPRFQCVAVDALKPAQRRIRVHKKGALDTLISLMERFKYSPVILSTSELEIIDGHLVLEAYKKLRFKQVPVRIIDHLDEAEIKAFRISLHAFLDLSAFDEPALSLDLRYIVQRDPLLLTFTALPMAKIDVLLNLSAPEPDIGAHCTTPKCVTSRLGDRWVCAGGSVIYCGDAKLSANYLIALGNRIADMLLCDPPYGIVPIKGVASGKHEEFIEGSSMSKEETQNLFFSFLSAMMPYIKDGAIINEFADWRCMYALTASTRRVGLTHLITCVWAKDVAGMGGLYSNGCEYCLILKTGNKPHINNVKLGAYGRNRTSLWSAPGLNQFTPGRDEALASHPTVKPVSLLMDAILDVTHPGHVVLDPFSGSGSTLVAAYRTKRIGVGIEISAAFVDVAVARMEKVTGEPVRHSETGLTFAEMAELRAADAAAARLS